MNFNGAMGKETVTVQDDGSFMVKGGGWFWCEIKRTDLGLSVVNTAPGMMQKKAARLFIQQAKRTIEKHYGS
jgi:hypothetical protein